MKFPKRIRTRRKQFKKIAETLKNQVYIELDQTFIDWLRKIRCFCYIDYIDENDNLFMLDEVLEHSDFEFESFTYRNKNAQYIAFVIIKAKERYYDGILSLVQTIRKKISIMKGRDALLCYDYSVQEFRSMMNGGGLSEEE